MPGHDIIPFLKALLNNVYGPKKSEDALDAKAKGFLPSNTAVIKKDDDIFEKGKQKVLDMFKRDSTK